ncbi:MAG: hypothetical protein ACKV2U_16675 [Bryobacteraceae bacterium]
MMRRRSLENQRTPLREAASGRDLPIGLRPGAVSSAVAAGKGAWRHGPRPPAIRFEEWDARGALVESNAGATDAKSGLAAR